MKHFSQHGSQAERRQQFRSPLALLASLSLVVGCFGSSSASGAGDVHPHEYSDAEGGLEFLQVDSKATLNGPMYIINIRFDWQTYDFSQGATIRIDMPSRSLVMEKGLDPKNGAVWAWHIDKLATTGWIELQVHTSENANIPNDLKAYCAGFMEGLMSAYRISQFYTNFYSNAVKDQDTMAAYKNTRMVWADVIEFVTTNTNLRGGQITAAPMDPYWKLLRYTYEQLWGLKEGYNTVALAKSVRPLDLVDFMVINTHAELPMLMEAYKPDAILRRQKFQAQAGLAGRPAFVQTGKNGSVPLTMPRGGFGKGPVRKPRQSKADKGPARKPPAAAMSMLRGASKHNATANATELAAADEDWEDRMVDHGHCTAFVRAASGNKDLLIGHTTWSDYNKMTRYWKHYVFHFPGSWQGARQISMSSYPGCISSTDDFYMLDSGLVIADTSLEILNERLYDRIPEFPANTHLPSFLHTMAVNWMAHDGNHWTSLYSEKNVGTNNAQWLILDYNRFVPGAAIQDQTLWMLEQIPGVTRTADLSPRLRTSSYFASYNRPYFADIREMTGHLAAEWHYGALYSWGANPRASIFSKVGPAVESLFDMRTVMTRNSYPHEGVLPNRPGHAISARMDLDTISHIPNGGIDAKVTNFCLFRAFTCQAMSSPTHWAQPVFKWRGEDGKEVFPGWAHFGLPDVWNFNFLQMTPAKMLDQPVDVATCSS